jgi:glycosyltransferase involved in cell wall biosynthesis
LKPVVLQLIDSFNQGGSERQALQLTRLLHNSGRFDVRLASLSPEGVLRASIADLDLGDTPSFPLRSFYDANAVKQLRSLVSWLKRSQASIIHTHDFYTNVFGMAAATLARLPVRIASMRETEGMRTEAQLKVQRIAYGLAHHVVANSEAVRNKLIELGLSEAKVTVIYNGLDTKRLSWNSSRAEAQTAIGLHGMRDKRFVTIVANMRHDVKDYPMFLRAAQRVRQAVPQAAFLLAGEGELSASLQRQATELAIESDLFFLGRCENIAALLSLSDVCVLSSKAEGFSNSILEYMAAGKPVVATDVGGAREAIVEGDTGFLVKSGDYAAMGDRIIELLHEPQRASAMGEKGRQVVDQKFSLAAQLERTEQLYAKLLSD